VALAVVVWFIAGMSLLVAGVVLSARTDARLAQLHLGRAQATAAGDGAVNLLMADVMEGRFRASDQHLLAQQRYRFGELEVSVVAVPMEWLVDINAVSPGLLANALRLSRAAKPEMAKALSDAVVQWRSGAEGIRGVRFESIEDLLAVPGMNRATWDQIRDYVAVPPPATSGVAKAGGRAQRALQRLRTLAPAQRVASDAAAEMNGGRSGSGSYRVDAIVRIGDTPWLRRRWVMVGGGQNALPWRVVRTEPARIVSK
jgi:type II secretory pathway component PulK